jgi:hypothetical protein
MNNEMLYVNETAELTGTGTSTITKINLTTVMISVTVVYVYDKLRFFKVWSSRCACRIQGVFKKRPNFLNSSPTSTEGALRLLSAPSGRF